MRRIVNYPKSKTTFRWKVHQIENTPLNDDHPFKFVVENGENIGCDGCVDFSPKFLVKQQKKHAAAATTADSHHTTKAPKATSTSPTQAQAPTSSASVHANPGVAAAEGGHGNSSGLTSSGSGSHHSHLATGLGVGLGLGIPIVLGLLALLFLFLRRRRKEQQRISYRPTGSGNWTTEQMGMTEAGNRESGALGPWEADRMSQSGLSEGSVHVRQSYAPSASGMSRMSHMSHRSWINDFEFERPELRDQDAMSQLRNSIHSSTHLGEENHPKSFGMADGGDSTRGEAPLLQQPPSTYFTPSSTPPISRKSVTNFGNTDLSSLEGIPEQILSSPLRPQRRSRGDGRDWPLP